MCTGMQNAADAAAQATPRGMRYQIALVGRRNVGKSSLLNAMTGQQISIVSETKGTTTDAVAKPYELLPLGPVTIFDTAGIDDEGDLGALRVGATHKVLCRADMAMLIADDQGLGDYELALIEQMQSLELPFLVVFNKGDSHQPSRDDLAFCLERSLAHICVSATTGSNISALKQRLFELAPEELKAEPVLAGDLYRSGDVVLCVAPIDTAAPKGRLILPQVQVLREALDRSAMAMVVKETELADALKRFTTPPKLVITDAQVIKFVDQVVPNSIPLTTFSSLFARFKGDLPPMVAGAERFDSLEEGDKVLIAEACSHNVQEDDIGRVKLPNWIGKYTGKSLQFDVVSGHDFPDNLEEYALVIHCGACMFNRTEMLRRVRECQRRGVPITNYGVAISKLQGVLPRVIAPLMPNQ
ncbi:[FeFe] hydrogenase H-cluster maturation GTPase HydF [Ferrimonas sp. YFM]|uniref:[FeFe] hydrogenase H-cluster maturation GTPase HydF n=1 Tax=Ferrimonas sp. YFM TaxID=3028878 RepID=UPI00257386AB|nr:[FeFe] hydrogenase H-cluster maturation GTPase HydF [Ferrimonas sp. YFM]BDY05974.1 [FeFe] hydrogenase H-cluster maturation GTPase HydF [Ferrimonas sp. YFM]